jgi:predicted P-loop ATPase/GTPase
LKSVYVFGLFPISPGKTVVSTALCRGLLREGLKAAPFKPRSGHNLWYQYDSFKRCRKGGRLFCEDIIKLREASGCSLPYEILNPIDALMAPMNARVFLENKRVREMYLRESDTFIHLLFERYTSWMEGKAKNILCLNKKNLSDESLIDDDYIRELTEKSEEIVEVEDVARWDSVFRRLGSGCIHTCSRRIAEEYEVMVVEGFNDAVCPAPELRYDVVIGVAPGVAALYDPDDFQRVIRVKSTISGEPRGMTAEEITCFIKPEKTFKIPALEERDLTNFDRLGEKLGNINKIVLHRLSLVDR